MDNTTTKLIHKMCVSTEHTHRTVKDSKPFVMADGTRAEPGEESWSVSYDPRLFAICDVRAQWWEVTA